jgi:hypothetical protein
MGKGHVRLVSSCIADDTKAEKVFYRIAEALTELARAKGVR